MRNIPRDGYQTWSPQFLLFWHILSPQDVETQRILNAILVSEQKESTRN
jgi:hypothetical protein